MQRLDRLADRIGDVVELEVEEDRQAELGHLAHTVAAVGGEEFETELEPADMVADLCRDRLRALEIGSVDRDEDRAAHEAGRAVPSLAARDSVASATGSPGRAA